MFFVRRVDVIRSVMGQNGRYICLTLIRCAVYRYHRVIRYFLQQIILLYDAKGKKIAYNSTCTFVTKVFFIETL